MKSFSSPIDLRLAAYAAAGLAVVAPALTPSAKASIVYSGALNLAVPNNISGIYLNFVTGATGTAGSAVAGYDFNPYGSGGLQFFFTAGNGDSGLTLNGTTYTVLQAFDYIGPVSTFSTTADEAAFRTGQTGGYLGIKFLNESTGVSNYGWVSLNTTSATGFPATITGYAYDNTGAALPAGVVPEPSTTMALSLGVLSLGAVGVRRWRKAKLAAA